MNSRWFLVQVTTLKRVIMENEREKALRMELEQLKSEVQRLQAGKDHLLELIKRLQRVHALGGSAHNALSPSDQHVSVAQAAVEYLHDTSCGDERCVCSAALSWSRSRSRQ